MEKSIASLLIFSLLVLLVATLAALLPILNFVHADAIANARDAEAELVNTRIELSSTSDPLLFRCQTKFDMLLSNIGSATVRELARSDLFVWFTGDSSGTTTQKRLSYTEGNLGKNEWAFTSTTSSQIDPTFWDPGEKAALTSRLSPKPATSTQAYVTFVTSNGAPESRYVSFGDQTASECFYLHNNPTPPVGDTASQTLLLVDTELPTASTLFNYDTDRNITAGLRLVESKNGLGETNATKFQTWRSGVLASDLAISGDTLVDVWAASDNYAQNEIGGVTAYLRDYNPGTGAHVEIGNGTVFARDWQAGSTTFVERMAKISSLTFTIPAGHELEVRLMIEKIAANAGMWLAYDTEDYPFLINLSYILPAAGLTFYLHNNPTPPAADTDSQAELPLDEVAPTATTLFDYDQDRDRDNDPGLHLRGTANGLSETLPTHYQMWRGAPTTSDLVIDGDIVIDIWAAIVNYRQSEIGVVTAYIRDFDGSSYTEIADGTVYSNDWQGGATDFVEKTIIIPDVSYTLPTGSRLEVRLIVDSVSTRDMWIAYDTTSRTTAVKLTSGVPAPPPPLVAFASDDFESGTFNGGTGWIAAWATTTPSDVNSLNLPFEGVYHMEVGKGGEAKRNVDLSAQTDPRLRFFRKMSGFSGNREAHLDYSTDGTTWILDVGVWDRNSAPGQDIYQQEDFDLTAYASETNFWIRFWVDGGGGGDRFLFIDDVKLVD